MMTTPPRVGDRVRIHVDLRCPHEHGQVCPESPYNGQQGVVVEIADYLPGDHIYAVEYPTPEAPYPVGCDDFTAAELEVVG